MALTIPGHGRMEATTMVSRTCTGEMEFAGLRELEVEWNEHERFQPSSCGMLAMAERASDYSLVGPRRKVSPRSWEDVRVWAGIFVWKGRPVAKVDRVDE